MLAKHKEEDDLAEEDIDEGKFTYPGPELEEFPGGLSDKNVL
jgi:hypothetical protein